MLKYHISALFAFLLVQIAFSQSEKIIRGKVVQEQFALAKVEVANFNSKETTITSAAGEFSILVKKGDELVFISKNHIIKKIVMDQNTLDKNNLLIQLVLKPEELEEVLITTMPSIQLDLDSSYEQEKLSELAIKKASRAPKVIGVNNGTIENGMNFMRIGGLLFGLFAKEKEKVKKKIPPIPFTALAKSSCDQKFYTETLKLKPDEIELFLQFCDADPKSKTLLESSTILSMMDFLMSKHLEFKKL